MNSVAQFAYLILKEEVRYQEIFTPSILQRFYTERGDFDPECENTFRSLNAWDQPRAMRIITCVKCTAKACCCVFSPLGRGKPLHCPRDLLCLCWFVA